MTTDDTPANVVELHPTEHVRCACGSVWWTTAVNVDRQTRSVVGYALPLACTDCGAENDGRRA